VSRIPSLSLTEEDTWRVVLLLGLALTLSAAIELTLICVPFQLSPPAWVAGTTATILDVFPQLGLGLALLLASGVALGLRWTVRSLAVLCVVASLLLWAAVLLYVMALPYLLQVDKPPLIEVQFEKTIGKTSLQAVLYPFLLLILAWRAWWATVPSKA